MARHARGGQGHQPGFRGREPRIYAHSWERTLSFFDGLELVPPGVVDCAMWRPGVQQAPRENLEYMIAAGVGRRAGGPGILVPPAG